MNGHGEEIPRWVWYTGQLLFHFQETLERCPQKTLSRFFDDFRESQGLQNCQGFQARNQGTMLMLLYGLLVVPREMWRERPLPAFDFQTRNRFQFHTGEEDIEGVAFLWYMRHAVAHANFAVDEQTGTYRFWNRGTMAEERSTSRSQSIIVVWECS